MSAFNFKTEVLDRSFDKPVVVDFWAPWCGPCRVIGPVLEQLAEEQAERWTLVKINSDEEQELSSTYKVMSIPNVKMFYQGKVVAEFAGALPRQAVLNWLDEHIPDSLQGDLQIILDQLDSGEAQALNTLFDFVRAHPDVPEARIALASRLVFSQPEQAVQWIEGISLGTAHYDAAEDLRVLARFLQFTGNGLPVAQMLAQSAQNAREGHLEPAIVHLIEAVGIDKSFDNDLPRKAAIALFRTLGPKHALTQAYRRKFDMTLY